MMKRRGKVTLFVLSAFLLFLWFFSIDKILFVYIVHLSNVDNKVAKALLKKSHFELCKTQPYRGSSEKYLLRDSNNKVWLFKTYSDPLGAEKDVLFSRLAQISGIRTSVCYEMVLPINDTLAYGSIQKVIENIEAIPQSLDSAQALAMIRAHIFKWLTGGDEIDVFMADGNIVLLDIGETLEQKSNTIKAIFEDIFMPFIENKRINEQSYYEAVAFVNFIQRAPDRWYRGMLKTLFACDYEQQALFLNRKNNLKDEYIKFYRENINRRAPEYYRSQRIPLKFYFDIIKNIRKDIVVNMRLLKETISRPHEVQTAIEVITSKECLRLISGLQSLENNVFSNREIAMRKNDITDLMMRLEHMRKEEKSLLEKLGISIYMAQLKSDIPGFVPALKRFTFHPEELAEVYLEAGLRVASVEWFLASEENFLGAYSKHFIDALNLVRDKDMQTPVTLLDNSTDYWSLLLLGRIFETGKKYCRFYDGLQIDEALRAYAMVLQKKNNSLTAYINLFQLFLLKRDSHHAVEILEEMLARTPEIATLWDIDMDAIGEISRLPDADKIKKMRMITLDKEGYYVMALFYFVKNDFLMAKRYLGIAKRMGFDEDLIREVVIKLPIVKISGENE